MELIYPYSKEHKVIKRDRIKIASAKALNYLQSKLHNNDSAIATLRFDIINAKKEIETTIFQKSNSFVRNYYNMAQLSCLMTPGSAYAMYKATFGDDSFSFKDTGGTIRTNAFSIYGLNGEGAVAVNTSGIQIGTGSTAESFEDYKLETLIAEGVGAGQMNYLATSFNATWDSGTSKWSGITQRVILNNSGAAITVNEVSSVRHIGLFGSTNWIVCLIRDVPTPMLVPIDGGIAVTYTITYQF